MDPDFKLKPTERLDKWKNFGYRLLLLGSTPDKFMENTVNQVPIFGFLIITLGVTTISELLAFLFLSRNLLEQITHFYIMTYILTFCIQWYFLLLHVRTFHEDEVYLERFESTKEEVKYAERKFNEHIDVFLKSFYLATAWWAINVFLHIFGPIIELLTSYFRDGKFKRVAVFPQGMIYPVWIQIIVYIHNSISSFLLLVYCMGNLLILGSQVLKIKTQCDILNEALRNDSGVEFNIKKCIRDHQKIIKTVKKLNKLMEIFYNVVFAACYFEFASQMFTITVFDPEGAYFLALVLDLWSVMLVLAVQCWLGAITTDALESVAAAVYETSWYRKNKNDSLNVLIMLQMAQREYFQAIWFKSVKVERASTLNLLRSSYAVYTVLMIFQKK